MSTESAGFSRPDRPALPWKSVLIGAAVLALLLRLPVVLRTSMWIDDGATLHTLALPLAELPGERLRMGHLPGFFLLFRAWVAAAGDSLLALRLPSLMASALTVPVLMLVGEKLGGRRTALVAGAIGLLHGTLLRNSAEMRMYPWLTLLGGLLVLATVLHRENPTGRRAMALGLCHLGLLQLHANAFVWSFVYLLGTSIVAWRGRWPRRWWIGFWGSFLGALLLTMPLLVALALRLDVREFEKFDRRPDLQHLFVQHFELLWGVGARTRAWKLPVATLAVLAALFWATRRPAGPAAQPPGRDLAWICALAGLAPPLVAWTISVLGRPMLGEPRYFTQATVPLIALLAAGLSGWRWLSDLRGRALSVGTAAVLAIGARDAVGRSLDVLKGQGIGINRLVAEVESNTLPGSTLVITHSVSVPEIVSYYLREEARFGAIRAVPRTATDDEIRLLLREAVRPDRDVALFLYKALDDRVEKVLRRDFGPWASEHAEDDDQPTWIHFRRPPHTDPQPPTPNP